MEHCSKQSTTYLACEMPIMKNEYLLQQELTVAPLGDGFSLREVKNSRPERLDF